MDLWLTANLMLVAGIVSGCAPPAPGSNLPTTKIQIGQKTFTLEIANREETRLRGLMYRDRLPADHGMIFVFPEQRRLSFWMRNTKIPLDILYLDSTGRVVSIHELKPYVEDGVPSAEPAQYAIELNRGAAARAAVKVGDVLQIPPEARNAVD